MNFRFVLKVDAPVRYYTGAMISTGDVVELTGHLAEKAERNPNYERTDAPVTRRRRGRPRKTIEPDERLAPVQDVEI